jgi:hypothetical protein
MDLIKIQDLEIPGLDAGNSTISFSEALLDLKTAHFWVITHRIVVVSYRRLTLRMGTDMLSRNVCKKLLHGGSLKSRICLDLCGYIYITAEGKTSSPLSTWKS